MTHPLISPPFSSAEADAADALISLALTEDLGERGDITTGALLNTDLQGNVQIVAREEGVLSGVSVGQRVLRAVDPACRWRSHCSDGERVTRGTVIASLTGPVRSLLAAERTILNFLTHLSGVATLTATCVKAVAGTGAQIFDTRKTLPGWRVLEKYAVRCGGGTNHRSGLWDAVLIKDNHLAALASHEPMSLADVVRVARANVPAGVVVEIEVDSLEQLADALRGDPDVVLLDNMDPATLREAVAVRDRDAPRVLLEASGGIDPGSVSEIARAGVDRISIGRLTHSAPALDLAFDWWTTPPEPGDMTGGPAPVSNGGTPTS